MNSVEALKAKAFESNYLYLNFLQKYRFDSDDVHYVFEGYEDQSFYFNYLQSLTLNYVTHISYGKPNSIKLYERLDWTKYDKNRVLIFIDRDYCRLLNKEIPVDKNIYETTFYSIENYIVDRSILKRLINEILHYHDNLVIERILEIFDEEYKSFFDLMKPIIKSMLIVRERGLNVNLNGIQLSKLLKINSDLHIEKIRTNKVEYLMRVTQVETITVSLSEYRKWHLKVNSSSISKELLRGKYDLWYLVSFLDKVAEYLKINERHNSRIKTNITTSNAIEIIGPRNVLPERLRSFISTWEREGQ